MKIKITEQGYQLPEASKMIDDLLTEESKEKLLKIHIDSLKLIKFRCDRTGYISKSERQYVEKLYIDIILNKYSFKKQLKKKKIITYQHIGMQMYHLINSQNLQKTL